MESNLILNKRNKNYAKECIDNIVEMGLDFKLQDNFRKRHVSESMIKDAIISDLQLFLFEQTERHPMILPMLVTI